MSNILWSQSYHVASSAEYRGRVQQWMDHIFRLKTMFPILLFWSTSMPHTGPSDTKPCFILQLDKSFNLLQFLVLSIWLLRFRLPFSFPASPQPKNLWVIPVSKTHGLNTFVCLSYSFVTKTWHVLSNSMDWSQINSTNHCLLKLGRILEWKSSQVPWYVSILY